ncbi:hypothetical protein D9756_010766 [Leucocoprinus leucothites]|uniref:DUF6533 domain-containing protein n=1 Tax=Leucocoprinus leucothites TaxID=201217 RepID=A0A8H5FSK6_9AGAR|nr:hypothetical protein D9756_010766 [Leucoagaricus leucothites]
MSKELYTRQYINVVGLALLLYDHILTWQDEIQYVWRYDFRLEVPLLDLNGSLRESRNSTWTMKATYFISRYFALAGHIVNVIYSSPYFIQRQNGDCLAWFKFQMGAMMVLVFNMEFIMMMRVHALYNHKFWVGAVLAAWYMLCRTYNAWALPRAVAQVETNINCIPIKSPGTSRWITYVVIILNQAMFWCLSYRKYRCAVRDGWSDYSLIRLVIRDNSWAFLLLVGVLVSLIPYDVYVKNQGHIIFCIMTCLLSIIPCRLVLNIRCLKYETDSEVEQVDMSTIVTRNTM